MFIHLTLFERFKFIRLLFSECKLLSYCLTVGEITADKYEMCIQIWRVVRYVKLYLNFLSENIKV